MWTAFGIMLGNIMGVAFGPSTGIKPSLGWRLMLGSTVVLPLIVCVQVYFCPESPRYVFVAICALYSLTLTSFAVGIFSITKLRRPLGHSSAFDTPTSKPPVTLITHMWE